MSYQEKRAIVNMTSSLLIFGVYCMIVFQKYIAGNSSQINDLSFWGKAFLILIPVTIAAKIIIYIIFSIINKIAADEEEPSITDERDKLIDLKSTRNCHWVIVFGFLLSMVSLALSMPPFVMFITLAVSGLISDMVADISQIYYYRKGV